MAFKIEKFGAEVSNAKSILGGISYYRYALTNDDDITTAGYFPSKLGLKEGDRIWVTPKTKTDADALYIVSSVSDSGIVTVIAAPSDTGQTIQVEELPEASADELGNIYQFVGTTGDTYTNGYFYKCTGAGEPVVYSWSQVDVQPAPEALPDQTGQSGKFLTTDGSAASWSDKPLQNTATGTNSLTILGTAASGNGAINIGVGSKATAWNLAVGFNAQVNSGTQSCCYGYGTLATNTQSLSLGSFAQTSADHAIQIGSTGVATTNSNANTFKVANANGNFEMMSADGTIPAARHATLPATDGTYVLKLTISGGVPTLAWVAE